MLRIPIQNSSNVSFPSSEKTIASPITFCFQPFSLYIHSSEQTCRPVFLLTKVVIQPHIAHSSASESAMCLCFKCTLTISLRIFAFSSSSLSAKPISLGFFPHALSDSLLCFFQILPRHTSYMHILVG